MTKVLTMGEIMLRLKPPVNERIIQTTSFEANYGGAEANVAASLALLGEDAAFLTKLPQNPLGDAALYTLRGYGVDTTRILRGGPRLGIYYFEKGASVRTTSVVYDRAGSSFALAQPKEFDWPTLFEDVDTFYFSGITAALSPAMASALQAACEYCEAHGITVVLDTNYRGKMWTPKQAQATMKTLLPHVSVVLAHDEDFEATLGIKAFDGDETRGIEQVASFEAAMREVQRQYPNIHTVGSILRDIRSVEDSDWTALLLQDGTLSRAVTHHLHVMEGVGSGDAFGAGLLHAMRQGLHGEPLINYALAASVLKLTIQGDINLNTDAEVKALMNHAGAMNR